MQARRRLRGRRPRRGSYPARFAPGTDVEMITPDLEEAFVSKMPLRIVPPAGTIRRILSPLAGEAVFISDAPSNKVPAKTRSRVPHDARHPPPSPMLTYRLGETNGERRGTPHERRVALPPHSRAFIPLASGHLPGFCLHRASMYRIYYKTENVTPADIASDSRFTPVIVRNGGALPSGRWQVVDVIDGF
ncbi:hypothetical protein DFH94DRAFT_842243 [Russula ochroleuca]|uniref:Uncharacterized protein n=1 Tax=Russula ochroleuca TaxID=152965 RepID=A0A9P5N4J3_9AGAM|nr:hypothetical protein DFH94DRAFT_842243 [Russula ochroleuca]